MNCDQCLEGLAALLDGELSHERATTVEAHVHSCAPCHAAWTEQRALKADLKLSFQDLRRGAPAPPAIATPRRTWAGGRFATAAALVILVGLGWALLPGLLAARDPSGLAPHLAQALRADGASQLSDRAMTQEFLVRLQTPEGPRAFHFARGAGGFLWQRVDPAEHEPRFDPTRYLSGSDGVELWVSAPATHKAQRFDLATRPTPLPRLLALALRDLALIDLAAANLQLEPEGAGSVWVRARFATEGGTATASLRLDTGGSAVSALRVELPGHAPLDLDAHFGSVPLDFSLQSVLLPGAEVSAGLVDAASDSQGALLQRLGYTPGAILPPGALGSGEDELQNLGYLGYL